jgi:hypothetical protein
VTNSSGEQPSENQISISMLTKVLKEYHQRPWFHFRDTAVDDMTALAPAAERTPASITSTVAPTTTIRWDFTWYDGRDRYTADLKLVGVAGPGQQYGLTGVSGTFAGITVTGLSRYDNADNVFYRRSPTRSDPNPPDSHADAWGISFNFEYGEVAHIRGEWISNVFGGTTSYDWLTSSATVGAELRTSSIKLGSI